MKLFWSLLCTLSMSMGVASANDGAWRTDIEQAMRDAEQSQKVVIVHFWNESCGPCRQWEKQVASNREVRERLSESFVAVKVNTSQAPEIARRYGVERIPQDVAIRFDGQILLQQVSPLEARRYLELLTRAEIASSEKTNREVLSEGVQSGLESTRPVQHADLEITLEASVQDLGRVQRVSGDVQDRGLSSADATRMLEHSNSLPGRLKPRPHDVRLLEPIDVPTERAPADSEHPLAVGLEGFCPVRLTEAKEWVEGDSSCGAIHRGHVYFFSNSEARERFLESPDRFTPLWSGADPVLAVDQGREVKGKRGNGLFVEGRVVLFENEQTLKQFVNDSSRYLQVLISWEESSVSATTPAPRAERAPRYRLQD